MLCEPDTAHSFQYKTNSTTASFGDSAPQFQPSDNMENQLPNDFSHYHSQDPSRRFNPSPKKAFFASDPFGSRGPLRARAPTPPELPHDNSIFGDPRLESTSFSSSQFSALSSGPHSQLQSLGSPHPNALSQVFGVPNSSSGQSTGFAQSQSQIFNPQSLLFGQNQPFSATREYKKTGQRDSSNRDYNASSNHDYNASNLDYNTSAQSYSTHNYSAQNYTNTNQSNSSARDYNTSSNRDYNTSSNRDYNASSNRDYNASSNRDYNTSSNRDYNASSNRDYNASSNRDYNTSAQSSNSFAQNYPSNRDCTTPNRDYNNPVNRDYSYRDYNNPYNASNRDSNNSAQNYNTQNYNAQNYTNANSSYSTTQNYSNQTHQPPSNYSSSAYFPSQAYSQSFSYNPQAFHSSQSQQGQQFQQNQIRQGYQSQQPQPRQQNDSKNRFQFSPPSANLSGPTTKMYAAALPTALFPLSASSHQQTQKHTEPAGGAPSAGFTLHFGNHTRKQLFDDQDVSPNPPPNKPLPQLNLASFSQENEAIFVGLGEESRSFETGGSALDRRHTPRAPSGMLGSAHADSVLPLWSDLEFNNQGFSSSPELPASAKTVGDDVQSQPELESRFLTSSSWDETFRTTWDNHAIAELKPSGGYSWNPEPHPDLSRLHDPKAPNSSNLPKLQDCRSDDHKIDYRSDHRSDHKNDYRSDHKNDHRSDHRSDHKMDHRSDHRSDHKIDHRSDHRSDHKNDHRSDHRSDHKSGKRTPRVTLDVDTSPSKTHHNRGKSMSEQQSRNMLEEAPSGPTLRKSKPVDLPSPSALSPSRGQSKSRHRTIFSAESNFRLSNFEKAAGQQILATVGQERRKYPNHTRRASQTSNEAPREIASSAGSLLSWSETMKRSRDDAPLQPPPLGNAFTPRSAQQQHFNSDLSSSSSSSSMSSGSQGDNSTFSDTSSMIRRNFHNAAKITILPKNNEEIREFNKSIPSKTSGLPMPDDDDDLSENSTPRKPSPRSDHPHPLPVCLLPRATMYRCGSFSIMYPCDWTPTEMDNPLGSSCVIFMSHRDLASSSSSASSLSSSPSLALKRSASPPIFGGAALVAAPFATSPTLGLASGRSSPALGSSPSSTGLAPTAALPKSASFSGSQNSFSENLSVMTEDVDTFNQGPLEAFQSYSYAALDTIKKIPHYQLLSTQATVLAGHQATFVIVSSPLEALTWVSCWTLTVSPHGHSWVTIVTFTCRTEMFVERWELIAPLFKSLRVGLEVF